MNHSSAQDGWSDSSAAARRATASAEARREVEGGSDTHHALNDNDGFRKRAQPILRAEGHPDKTPICRTASTNLPDGQISKFLSSPRAKNIPLSPSGKSALQLAPSCPERGALRNVIDVGRDAVDAGGAQDGSATCGRRSRVVLTPRRWRQIGEGNFTNDGDNKARSPGRARRKPLKPLRGECRANRRDRGD